MATALISDPLVKRHQPGMGHPERPERFDAVMRALEQAGLKQNLLPVGLRVATEDEIALCHGRGYITTAKREIQGGASELSTGDTQVGPASYEVGIEAVGGVLNAVDVVMQKEVSNAFCVVRPPGHHARPDHGMGFCIFNNIAIGARYAQKKFGVSKVLIADWDVHHGNGTQDIFWEDGSVFFFSTHQAPWYPGTGAAGEIGEGKGEGTTLNCPFPAGSGDAQIGDAFRERLRRAAQEFRPELVMISAGFDSRLGDPLGQFTLSDADFEGLTRVMLEIAGEYAGGRLISVLEGGYNLEGLGAGAAAHVKQLMEGV